MSFILDALKKSESDRQRQSGPSLFEVKVAPPRRRLPIWAVAIALLLVINAVVVSWMLLRRPAAQKPAGESPPASSAQAIAATVPAATAGAAAAAGAVGTAPSTQGAGSAAGNEPQSGGRPDTMPGPSESPGRQTAAPTDAALPPTPTGALPPAGTGGATSARESGVSQAVSPRAGAAPAPAGNVQSGGQARENDSSSDFASAVEPAGAQGAGEEGGATGALPLYQQIVESANMPPLHLDLHVYAERPQDRFAMINMQRVGEGDSLPSGPRVEAIRPDGVVLAYHGTRFLLPRN